MIATKRQQPDKQSRAADSGMDGLGTPSLPAIWFEYAGDLGFKAVGGSGVVMSKLFGNRAAGLVGILTYHRIAPRVPGLPKPLHNVTPERFDQQITTLLGRGFVVWPLSRIIDYGARGQCIPPRTIALTFDDGYESVYTNAFPVLRKLEVPATVFLCTGYLDEIAPFPFDEWGMAFHDRAAPEMYRPLTTAQCLEMADGGLVELGSHTHTHEDFRRRPDAFRRDLEISVEILRSKLAQGSVSFAFPFGKAHNGFAGEELVSSARQTDVNCALMTESLLVDPASDPFGWGRFTVFPWDTGATLAAKLDGWYSWAPKLLHWVRRTFQRGAPA